jgi:hypothetical protein
MATTTNFGWETPDDTDLVKDGAAAIRTLGQSIDTSMADLEGGTSGQILAKNSNTDMDFIWTSDAGIPATILDAKGDIIAATAADTASRLAVGANGTVLTADSTTGTGLKWATVAAGGLTQLYTSAMSGLSTITTSTLAGTYKQLWIEMTNARTTSGNSYLRVNGDTGSNYYRIGFQDAQFNSAPTWVNAAFLYIGQPQSSTSDMYSLTQINNYATSNAIKTGQNYGTSFNAGTPTSTANYQGIWWWNSSSAITTITIYNSASTNWTAGTFTVWGLN